MSPVLVNALQEEILDLLNEEFGFTYDLETPWNALFADQPTSGDMDGGEISLGNDTWAGFLASAALAESDSEDEDFRWGLLYSLLV